MTRNVRWIAILAALAATSILAGCKGSVDSQIKSARQNEAAGEYRTAMINLKNLLQSHPNNGEAWLLLGKASLWLGSPADAQSELDKAKAHGISESEIAVPLAHTLLVSGKLDELLAKIKPELAQSASDRAQILVIRGGAYLAQNKPDDAEKSFNSALQIEPRLTDAIVGLASVDFLRDDAKAAEAKLDEARQIDPDDARAWMVEGKMQLAAKHFDKAEQAFTRALAPKHSSLLPQLQFTTRANLAEAQIRQGKNKPAIANLDMLYKIAPDQPYPNYLRALVAYRMDDYDTAEAKLQQVLKVTPDNEPAQLLMAMVDYARGSYGQAEMNLSSIIGSNPDNIDARKLFALTLYKEGQPEQAVQVLRPAAKGKYSDVQLLAMIAKASGGKGHGNEDAIPITAQPSTAGGPEALQFAARDIAAGQPEQALDILNKMPASKGGYARDRLVIAAYLRKGDSDKALSEAHKLIKANAKAAEPRLILAATLIAAGRSGEAEKAVSKAAALEPDNIEALLTAGALELKMHRYKDAAARYRKVLDARPKSTKAMIGLARVEDLQRRHSQALVWVQKAREANPKALEPRLILVRYYTTKGQFDQALDIAQEMDKIAPDNAMVLNALGIAQSNSGDKKSALANFAKAAEKEPQSPTYRTNLARAEIIAGDFDKARDNLKTVVDHHPDFIPGVALDALLKVQQGKIDDAIALAKSLREDGRNAALSYALEGDLYLLGRRYSEAAYAYEKAVEQKPARALVIKELTASGAAHKREADTAALDWIADHPDDAAMRSALGGYYLDIGDNDKAIAQYLAVLKRYPRQVAALNNLAWLYTLKQDSQAVDYARKAHKLAPKSASVTDTLGWALFQTGHTTDAVKTLREAVALAPQAPDARYHLAAALAKGGDKAEARKLLAKLLTSAQDFSSRDEARRLYASLK